MVVGSGVSTAFGTTNSSRILFLTTETGSTTKVVLEGGAVAAKRSSMSTNASEQTAFTWTCAS